MTIIEALKKELEKEAITTRKMLSIVPTEKFSWQPHPKSMTVIRLATHIAELPTWIGITLNTIELDFEKNPYSPVILNDNEELVNYFEKCLEEGRNDLNSATEKQLEEMWTLRSGSTIFQAEPKYDMLRLTFSQVIHHRAQLGVFLRLLNIPIPGSYGPSADESF